MALRLLPRVLVDVQGEDLGTTFLGRRYNLPFGIAPMAEATSPSSRWTCLACNNWARAPMPGPA
jgi:isopentenyl diphosphate isomerase/L-lactate dehydrogenase-like FMN-dependent dehydrogenase